MGRFHRHGVHDGIDGHAGELFLLLEWYAELVEGFQKFRVDFVEALWPLFGNGRSIVAYCLEIDFGHVEMPPFRRCHGEPVAVCFQPEIEQPLRLPFLFRNQANHIFA